LAAGSLEQTQAAAMVEGGRVRAVGRALEERVHAAKIDKKIVKIQDSKRAHGAKLLQKNAKLKRSAQEFDVQTNEDEIDNMAFFALKAEVRR
jgi:hypothetical protein